MIAAAGLSVPRPVSATDEDSRMAEEQWRPVVGYEDAYEVSDRLRVRSIARTVQRTDGHEQSVRERILTPAV